MDGAEDSPYLALLNDGNGTHNFLLQNTEEDLGVQDASLNVEPMFTEIEDGSGSWSVGLPILLNADQVLESPIVMPTEVEPTITLPTLYEESLESHANDSLKVDESTRSNPTEYPSIDIPGKGYLSAGGLFFPNELLMRLKLESNLNIEQPKMVQQISEQEDILINPKTLIPHNGHNLESVEMVKYECNKERKQKHMLNDDSFALGNNLQLIDGALDFDVANLNEQTNTVIRLLDGDGMIIDINKEQLLNYNGSNGDVVKVISEEECFEIVVAHKCKQCLVLFESRDDAVQHWKIKHAQNKSKLLVNNGEKPPMGKNNDFKLVQQRNGIETNGEVKMRSILKVNDQQTVYLCSKCNLGYGSTEKLKIHMILAHKLAQRLENNVQVNGNKPSEGKTKFTAAIIQKQAKAAKKIKCSVKGCDLRFAKDEMRIRHEKCHVDGQKKQFRCFECNTKFSLWRICSLHMWKCHNIDLGLLTCPMCSTFKTTGAVRLMTHMAIHGEEKPYLCNECGKTFKQHSQLRNHQVGHRESDNVPDWAGQQQCNICKKFFATAKSLKKHIQSVHDKYKPFICNICGHKAARKAMLELHLRQHTGEKPHKCPICDFKTGDHNSLRRHIMRHNGDTKYSCPHCNYSSIQSTSYKKHISNKHPGLGGSYFCSLCLYHTVNEDSYHKHCDDHRKGLIRENCDTDGTNDVLHKPLACIEEESALLDGDKQKQNDDDDEMQNYLLSMDHSNDAIDTGGITIPAGFELQVPLP